ncbi:hypothetical protein PVAND_017553 [Polypedilum vanderplanki]|uniref:Glycosyl transferase CAP10 domain-containing protein n=1 Tax=Polypedilum vanderplanki TaxID=319348 RepID=A0A9J6BJV7_POLVA|nr:hypothetical protein PVAND_017553 [Polypedilum vanderplanki]
MSLRVILIVSLLIYQIGISKSQTCDKEKNSEKDIEVKNNKNYDKFSNEILKNINEALQNYTPCNATGCSCHSNVLKNDFKPFQNGITREILDKLKDRGTIYQIIDNKIYRQKDCNFPSRCSGVEYFIKNVLKSVKLPSMEIIINVRDYPQILPHYGPQGPVLSFSKTDSYNDIMYPAWAFREGGPAIKLYPTGLGRWDQHRENLSKVADEFPWSKKKSKAFFRGSRTSDERDSLVLLSRLNPDLADAQYTKNQAWKSIKDTLNVEPAEEVSLEYHCRYKYLFNYRGVAASFRFKHLFLCKSLVFHVGDEWKEFFYDSLKPWVHYVPVDAKTKPEELKGTIEFFKEHDNIAKEIAERGFDMIWKNLRMEDVECYWRRLLRSYGRLMKFEVKRNEEFIEIK